MGLLCVYVCAHSQMCVCELACMSGAKCGVCGFNRQVLGLIRSGVNCLKRDESMFTQSLKDTHTYKVQDVSENKNNDYYFS